MIGSILQMAVFAAFFLTINAMCIEKKYSTVPGHTGCLQPNKANILEKGISESDKELIVNLHNEYRSREPAADMQKMVWDDEIAAIAEKWADNCLYEHDDGSQRSIPGRFSVGQNLALGYNKWENVIFGWYDEVKYFTYGSSSNVFSQVGHFTQLTWSNTTKVGCAYAKCSSLIRNFFNGKFWVCNYGPAGNIGDVNKPYKRMRSSKCEDCPGKCNEEAGLCDCGGMACENGGIIDLKTCTCNCKEDFHVPGVCALDCTAAKDRFYCGTQWPKSYCTRFTNVPSECPNLCDVCPFGGIDYRKSTTNPAPVTTTQTETETTTPADTETETTTPADTETETTTQTETTTPADTETETIAQTETETTESVETESVTDNELSSTTPTPDTTTSDITDGELSCKFLRLFAASKPNDSLVSTFLQFYCGGSE